MDMDDFEWDFGRIERKIGSKTDLEMKDKNGQCALTFACLFTKELDIIKSILKAKVNVNMKQKETVDNDTPLIIACREGNLDKVKLLLKYGAKPQISNKRKVTPLHISSQHGYKEIIQLLTEKGADVCSQHQLGQTALMLSVYSGDVETVKMLIEAGSPLEAKDNGKSTVILYAFHRSEREIANYLLELKPDINPLFTHVDFEEFFNVTPHLKDYIEKHVDTLTPENLKTWKSLRLKSLFV